MPRSRKSQRAKLKIKGTAAYLAHKRRRVKQRMKKEVAQYAENTLGYKSPEASFESKALKVESLLFVPFETDRRKH